MQYICNSKGNTNRLTHGQAQDHLGPTGPVALLHDAAIGAVRPLGGAVGLLPGFWLAHCRGRTLRVSEHLLNIALITFLR